ncbi:MAG: RAMP superfamily CRISPR-associated protein [Flavobacterium sp.]|nr:RAMP superfamily CRISPR-associated protein [Flavobacterium sp.]
MIDQTKSNNERKKGMFVLKGIIELQTPMLIGSGDNENSDIDILRDVGGNPFIPATSFVGVLKEHLKSIESDVKDNNWKMFWGYSEVNESRQSNLSCSDLLSMNAHEITVRDGVRINRKNGMAESGGKFDFEVVERAVQFSSKLSAQYNTDNEKFIKKMLNTIKYELENSKVRIGAKTQSGLGKIILKNAGLFEYDFSKKADVLKYFKKEEGNKVNLTDKFDLKYKEFIIDAWFDLKTSLISRSYSTDPSAPDATHIQSNGEYILPGTGLKGVISSRAEKILRTKFDNDKVEQIYNSLFGFVDEKKKEARRSRILVEERILDNDIKDKFIAEQQTRIKIDRFTGGTMQGALFDSMPLFRKNKTNHDKVINIKMCIREPQDYEIGLILLVLKDLWTSDLPIGGEKNVGRGVLEGVSADLYFGNETKIQITEENILSEDKKNELEKELQKFVEALNNYEVKK